MIILGPRCDNGNVQLKFMGKMKATLTSNGWSAKTYIDVFGGGGGWGLPAFNLWSRYDAAAEFLAGPIQCRALGATG